MSTTKERNDVVSYVADGNSDGSTKIIFRYRDGTTKTFENGSATPSATGTASDTATWWR